MSWLLSACAASSAIALTARSRLASGHVITSDAVIVAQQAQKVNSEAGRARNAAIQGHKLPLPGLTALPWERQKLRHLCQRNGGAAAAAKRLRAKGGGRDAKTREQGGPKNTAPKGAAPGRPPEPHKAPRRAADNRAAHGGRERNRARPEGPRPGAAQDRAREAAAQAQQLRPGRAARRRCSGVRNQRRYHEAKRATRRAALFATTRRRSAPSTSEARISARRRARAAHVARGWRGPYEIRPGLLRPAERLSAGV